MAQLSSPVDLLVAPAQVWANLSTDLQSHAIRLLAQLAWAYAAAQTEPPSPEVSYDSPARSNQDPPRAS